VPKLFCFKNTFISVWNLCPTDLSVNKTGNVRINLTLRRVRVTVLAAENNKHYVNRVCVCSLSYPAYKAHAPYDIVICGLSGSTVFIPHYLIKGKILGGEKHGK
jgi:hypothetical protein